MILAVAVMVILGATALGFFFGLIAGSELEQKWEREDRERRDRV